MAGYKAVGTIALAIAMIIQAEAMQDNKKKVKATLQNKAGLADLSEEREVELEETEVHGRAGAITGMTMEEATRQLPKLGQGRTDDGVGEVTSVVLGIKGEAAILTQHVHKPLIRKAPVVAAVSLAEGTEKADEGFQVWACKAWAAKSSKDFDIRCSTADNQPDWCTQRPRGCWQETRTQSGQNNMRVFYNLQSVYPGGQNTFKDFANAESVLEPPDDSTCAPKTFCPTCTNGGAACP